MSDEVEVEKVEEVITPSKPKKEKKVEVEAAPVAATPTKPVAGPNERIVEYVGSDGKVGYKTLRRFNG